MKKALLFLLTLCCLAAFCAQALAQPSVFILTESSNHLRDIAKNLQDTVIMLARAAGSGGVTEVVGGKGGAATLIRREADDTRGDAGWVEALEAAVKGQKADTGTAVNHAAAFGRALSDWPEDVQGGTLIWFFSRQNTDKSNDAVLHSTLETLGEKGVTVFAFQVIEGDAPAEGLEQNAALWFKENLADLSFVRYAQVNPQALDDAAFETLMAALGYTALDKKTYNFQTGISVGPPLWPILRQVSVAWGDQNTLSELTDAVVQDGRAFLFPAQSGAQALVFEGGWSEPMEVVTYGIAADTALLSVLADGQTGEKNIRFGEPVRADITLESDAEKSFFDRLLSAETTDTLFTARLSDGSEERDISVLRDEKGWYAQLDGLKPGDYCLSVSYACQVGGQMKTAQGTLKLQIEEPEKLETLCGDTFVQLDLSDGVLPAKGESVWRLASPATLFSGDADEFCVSMTQQSQYESGLMAYLWKDMPCAVLTGPDETGGYTVTACAPGVAQVTVTAKSDYYGEKKIRFVLGVKSEKIEYIVLIGAVAGLIVLSVAADFLRRVMRARFKAGDSLVLIVRRGDGAQEGRALCMAPFGRERQDCLVLMAAAGLLSGSVAREKAPGLLKIQAGGRAGYALRRAKGAGDLEINGQIVRKRRVKLRFGARAAYSCGEFDLILIPASAYSDAMTLLKVNMEGEGDV